MRISKISHHLLILLCIISIGITLPSQKLQCSSDEIQIPFSYPIPQNYNFVNCLPKTEEIIDCLAYTGYGQCGQCPPESSVGKLETIDGSTAFKKACIPFSQQAYLCSIYKYTPQYPIKFECIACPVELQLVDMIPNRFGMKKGCSQSIVPGCKQYFFIFQSNPIRCKTCQDGLEAWQGKSTQDYYCVKPNSIKNCTKLTLTKGQYFCDSSVCSTRSLSFKFGQTSLTCAEQSTGNAATQNCHLFNYNYQGFDDRNKLKCLQCRKNYGLVSYFVFNFYNDITQCIDEKLVQKGCKNYAKNTFDDQQLFCFECISDQYELIQIDQAKYKPHFLEQGQKVGICVLKGRYDKTQTRCQTFANMKNTESALACDTCKNSALQPPCLPKTISTCTSTQGQVQILTSTGSQAIGCIEKDKVIDFCSVYSENTDECAQCKAGYSLIRAILYRIGSKNTKTICLSSSSLIQKCAIYDHDNLKTCLVFSTAGDNRDENCLKLDSTDSSKCAKCLPGWTLANDHLTCVYTGDNCKEFDETKTPPKCISCQNGFRFVALLWKGLVTSTCVPASQIISHCQMYAYKYGRLECSQCKAASSYTYGVIPAIENGLSTTKCILNQQSVAHCISYTQFLNTCVYKCQMCQQGFRLVNVQVGPKIVQRCLDVFTEYFDDCGWWIQYEGQVYCKKGHCVNGSKEIVLGLSEKQIACTQLDLMIWGEENQCNYYFRPNIFIKHLECANCVIQWAYGYYCSTTQ